MNLVNRNFKHGITLAPMDLFVKFIDRTKSMKLGRVEVIYPYRDITSPTVLSLVNCR